MGKEEERERSTADVETCYGEVRRASAEEFGGERLDAVAHGGYGEGVYVV